MRNKRDHTTDPEWGLYCCSGCQRLLQLEQVLSARIERRDGTVTGHILFRHYCACDPDSVRLSRRWGSYPSFLALFGCVPPLPYRSPFQWRPVLDTDPGLVRWRWELGQVADAHEFLLFADEAARRRTA